jgi:hypothetical protein
MVATLVHEEIATLERKLYEAVVALEGAYLSTKSYRRTGSQIGNNLLNTNLLQIQPCTSLFLNRFHAPSIIYFPNLALDLLPAVPETQARPRGLCRNGGVEDFSESS